MIQRLRFKKFLVLLICVGLATPALAGLIYQWQEWSGYDAVGMVEFADGVDVVDDESDIVAFSFETPQGLVFDKAFAFDALQGVVVGGEELCGGDCPTTKKKAAKKKAAKKPAAKKKAATELTPLSLDFIADVDLTWLFDWLAVGSFETKTATKKTAGGTDGDVITEQFQEDGYGYWARIAVPEPSVLLLIFTGLGLISFARRKLS